VSYNACVVKIYRTARSLVHFERKNYNLLCSLQLRNVIVVVVVVVIVVVIVVVGT
jgi:hypothetical protein